MSAPDTSPPSKPRTLWLTLFYAAILVAVVVLHMRGGLATPAFIYQGF
jgi:hypothetical protein